MLPVANIFIGMSRANIEKFNENDSLDQKECLTKNEKLVTFFCDVRSHRGEPQ